MSSPSSPQSQSQPLPDGPQPQTGNIAGTVLDENGGTVAGAVVVLEGPAPKDHRKVTANDRGFFELQNLEPGTPYRVTVSAPAFSDWTSPVLTLNPGQYLILTGCKLEVAEVRTTVEVGYTSEQIAAEQVKNEEKQRIFGIVPNFYVVYDHNAEPLTTKLKFKLALRTSVDPVTFIGAAFIAGINQAADSPAYGGGARAYGQQLGAAYAGGVADIMIGGAVLPSLLHQDPRYYYQGTGTKKSRALHAISYPFVCKGDNGRRQPNYSTIGGDLAAASIAQAYIPASDRGAGQMLENLLINTAERMGASLAQEFVMSKFTHKAKKKDSASNSSK